MKRSAAREIAVQLSFAAANGADVQELLDGFFSREHYESLSAENELFSDYPNRAQMEYIRRLTALTAENRAEIDALIKKYSKGWRPERISRTALAVMRCAVCEILYMDDIPNSAAINEAVELAKNYDEPDTVAFVNGVLGGIVRGELGNQAEEARE